MAYSQDSWRVAGIFSVAQVRAHMPPPEPGDQAGESCSIARDTRAKTARNTETMMNGAPSPHASLIGTVENDAMAVPPMPAPKMPMAVPRRAGGYQLLTNGTPMANVVPPRPRKNPPIRSQT